MRPANLAFFGALMNIEQATINDAAEILALQKLAYVSEAEI